LATFAIIWVHTQRVPEAKTSPPRLIKIGVIVSLVVLALVRPALSQGPADLDTAPSVLKLDWFYLWTYPLLYTWGPGKVWALAGGVTVFALLLPVMGRKGRGRNEYQISAIPCGRVITARRGETVLEAALRQGLALPYLCRDGACGTCKGKLLKGAVDYGTYQKGVLTAEEKKQGMALFCCAKPKTDLDIECHEIDLLKRFPIKKLEVRINRMERAAQDVMLLESHIERGEHMDFIAGQYVAVLMDDGTKRSFSIANPPYQTDQLHLHIRLVDGGKFTGHVFDGMKEGDVLRVEGPYGSFFLHEESDKPIIFMAGGTGFAPVKSMLEHALDSGIQRQMTLYWGAKIPADLYLAALPEKWQQEHGNFRFIPVLSEVKPVHGWQGRTGLVTEAILHDHQELSGYQVYACGSPAMVDAGREAFIARGLPPSQYFSDAFLLNQYKSAISEGEASSGGEVHA
jgi:CDP-4-dehydro-6-deoxyglucose reductase